MMKNKYLLGCLNAFHIYCVWFHMSNMNTIFSFGNGKKTGENGGTEGIDLVTPTPNLSLKREDTDPMDN